MQEKRVQHAENGGGFGPSLMASLKKRSDRDVTFLVPSSGGSIATALADVDWCLVDEYKMVYLVANLRGELSKRRTSMFDVGDGPCILSVMYQCTHF